MLNKKRQQRKWSNPPFTHVFDRTAIAASYGSDSIATVIKHLSAAEKIVHQAGNTTSKTSTTASKFVNAAPHRIRPPN
jgi:hypothetical protein